MENERRTGLTLLEVVIGVVILLLLFLVLVPVGGTPRHAATATQCISNVKQVGLGLKLYQTDYDDWNPKADAWVTSIDPYVKSRAMYKCPDFSAPYAYALMDDAAGKGAKLAQDPAREPMAFESTKGTLNAHDRLTSLPIPGRHAGKNTFVFVDGHAKRIQTVQP
jgi:prepilin-type processing-associated H-X9-DG protein